MGSCFQFELLVRLLAQKFFSGESVTRDIADGRKGTGLLTLLFQRLSFSEDEQLFLPKCNTLRNKLIHCEPDGVLRTVQELMPDFSPGNVVQQLKLERNATGAAILRTIEKQEGAVAVLTTDSRTEGFLGWMVQAANDGTFDRATQLLQRGMLMIDSKAAHE